MKCQILRRIFSYFKIGYTKIKIKELYSEYVGTRNNPREDNSFKLIDGYILYKDLDNQRHIYLSIRTDQVWLEESDRFSPYTNSIEVETCEMVPNKKLGNIGDIVNKMFDRLKELMLLNHRFTNIEKKILKGLEIDCSDNNNWKFDFKPGTKDIVTSLYETRFCYSHLLN